MQVEPGTRLGPYEILAPLGAGGMGEVWRARDTRLDRSVALKILPAHFRNNSQFRARFDREARAISSLNHPHICTLHDVGDDYLVMELLEGETLAGRIARGALPLAEVIRYGGQIAAALEAAHRRGIIHRDLKPGNIMITRSGAKLLDFGLARTGEPVIDIAHDDATQQKALTAEGTILGTFQYMAPEQLEGQHVDHRADIFALGAVLYEMATGRRAFEGRSKTSLIAAIVAADPRPLREAQPLAPAMLEKVIFRCLEKAPDDRWQNAADVAHALTLGGIETQSQPAAPKKRWLMPVLSALAILCAALASFTFATRNQRVERRPVRASLLPPPSHEYDDNAGYALSISPDARWVTFRVRADDVRLWVRRIDTGEARPLEGTENAFLPMWSPDSRAIAFFTGTKLKRVALDGTPARTICATREVPRRGAWTTTGEIIFAPDPMSGLMRVKADGGTPAPLTKLEGPGETTHRWASFLPDGKHFLYLAGNHRSTADAEDHAVYVAPLDEPSKRKLIVRARSNAVYANGHLLYARGGVLVAQPFDVDALATAGEPFPVATSVAVDTASFLSSFAVADDGTLVYLSAPDAAQRQLMWIDPRSPGEPQSVGTRAAFELVRLSPDGKRAAEVILDTETGLPDLWVEDLATGHRARLTSTPDRYESDNIWSPDGKQIVFSRGLGFGAGTELVIVNADGSNERVISRRGWNEVPTSWTPDGSAILGFAWSGTGYREREVVKWNARDGSLTRLMIGYQPRVSPDGRWFHYTSGDANDSSVWVARTADGSRRQQISRGKAEGLTWSGDRIFLRNAAGVQVLAVKTGEEAVTIEGEVARFPVDRVQYVDSIDGNRMLCIVNSEAAADRALTLVSDFTAR